MSELLRQNHLEIKSPSSVSKDGTMLSVEPDSEFLAAIVKASQAPIQKIEFNFSSDNMLINPPDKKTLATPVGYSRINRQITIDGDSIWQKYQRPASQTKLPILHSPLYYEKIYKGVSLILNRHRFEYPEATDEIQISFLDREITYGLLDFVIDSHLRPDERIMRKMFEGKYTDWVALGAVLAGEIAAHKIGVTPTVGFIAPTENMVRHGLKKRFIRHVRRIWQDKIDPILSKDNGGVFPTPFTIRPF